MADTTAVMQQALEALENSQPSQASMDCDKDAWAKHYVAKRLLRTALAAQQPAEPLTDERIKSMHAASEVYEYHPGAVLEFARDIERAVRGVEITAYQPQGQMPSGQPGALQPLTRQQIDDLVTHHFPLDSLLTENVDKLEAFVRDAEKLLGIGATGGAQG